MEVGCPVGLVEGSPVGKDEVGDDDGIDDVGDSVGNALEHIREAPDPEIVV